MALVQLGPMLSDIRGSIGGTVFTRTRSGLATRKRVKPVQPNSPAQLLQRGRMTTLQVVWRGMSAINRQSWASAAILTPFLNRLGATIHLTGEQLFFRSNLLMLYMGFDPVLVAPLGSTKMDFPVFLIGTTETGLGWPENEVNLPDGAAVIFQISDQMPKTLNKNTGRWITHGPYTPTTFNAGQTLVLSDDIQNSRRFFLRWRLIQHGNDAGNAAGRCSDWVYGQIDTAE